MKKVLAIVLAVIMLLSVMPFAFAEEPTEADAQVAEWKTNDALLLAKLFDETTYSHYKYVLDNDKSIRDKMNALTFFGFSDGTMSWIDYDIVYIFLFIFTYVKHHCLVIIIGTN